MQDYTKHTWQKNYVKPYERNIAQMSNIDAAELETQCYKDVNFMKVNL